MIVPRRLFLLLVAVASASDMACLKTQLWANEDCSGDPDNASTITVATIPSEDCVPFDDPTFGQCSLNHQYCDMLVNAFKETVYISSDSCSKSEAFFVQDQVFESGKCYGGPDQSVLVECIAGACPSSSSAASEHRALLSLGTGIVLEY